MKSQLSQFINRISQQFHTCYSRQKRRAMAVGRAAHPGEFLEVRTLMSATPTRPVINEPGVNPKELSWSEGQSDESYELWVNNLTTSEYEVIHLYGLKGTSVATGRRLQSGRYRAWVRASNSEGTSQWSAPADFVVGRYTTVPDVPAILGPATGVDGRSITVTWKSASRAESYELWIDNLSTGQSQVIHQRGLSDNRYSTQETFTSGRYRVWVRASNAFGESSWSKPLEFEMARPAHVPPAPVIQSVTIDSFGNADVRWNSADDDVEYWRLSRAGILECKKTAFAE